VPHGLSCSALIMKGKKSGKKEGAPRVTAGALLLVPDQARELLHKEWRDVTEEERLRVLNASADAKPVPSARNPNNFDDLIPSEGGYRVKGIWKKSLDAVVDADRPQPPAHRNIYNTPAGLCNLGNTCFVNSALQVLFTNTLFRNAIFRLEEEVVQQDEKGILKELRKLFIEMQFGDNSTTDPTTFLEVLKLQGSEQQDAQEFQKLLMQELERSMSRSQDAQVRIP
jgi:Ubiquitin carboxyl-terminal hydrolase